MTDDYLVEVRVVLLQEAGLKLCKLNEKPTSGTRVSASAAPGPVAVFLLYSHNCVKRSICQVTITDNYSFDI